MATKKEPPQHFCRHCSEKFSGTNKRTVHNQWAKHYREHHGDLPREIFMLATCNKNCLGALLADELQTGRRNWGSHPDRPRPIPSEDAVERANRLLIGDR